MKLRKTKQNYQRRLFRISKNVQKIKKFKCREDNNIIIFPEIIIYYLHNMTRVSVKITRVNKILKSNEPR